MAQLDLRDRREMLGRKGRKDPQERMALTVLLDPRDHKGLLDLLVQTALTVQSDRKEMLGRKGRRDPPGPMALTVLLDHKEMLDRKGPKEMLDRKVRRDLPDPRVPKRTWPPIT